MHLIVEAMFRFDKGSCSMQSNDPPDGFAAESSFCIFTGLICSSVAMTGIYPLIFWGMIPAIEHIHRRRLLWNVRRMFISMIGLSICNQLASALTARPLAMSLDVRLHSALVMQCFGIGLPLLGSFICGVRYASNAFLLNRKRFFP
jgi:hypothetical protein